MAKRKHHVDGDRTMNSALREEVGTVRGAMCDAAESVPIPVRFDVVPCEERPAMKIVDKTTGRETIVPIFAYRAIREALSDLFPG